MAYQIRITPDQMRERANQYRTQAEIIAEVIARMDSLISALQGEWEGAAFEAFVSVYQEKRPVLMHAVDLAHQIGDALKSTGHHFEEMDHQLAQAFQSFNPEGTAFPLLRF